jgi:O-methyltransferase
MKFLDHIKSTCPPAIRRPIRQAFDLIKYPGRLVEVSRLHENFKEPIRFCEDGLATIHNCDFLQSPRFLAAYKAGEQTGSWRGWQLRWRAYVVCWAASYAVDLDGDFVECGVNRGGNARMIIEYLGEQQPRNFFLLDTFNGFVDQYLSDAEKLTVAKSYSYPDCLADVRRTFASFPFVRIIPGSVPDTLDEVSTTRVSFISIDMNCAAPEIQAATHFWPILTPGGVMVLDDYGFSSHYEQKIAFDGFARDRGVPILSLPTGQALIFKSR